MSHVQASPVSYSRQMIRHFLKRVHDQLLVVVVVEGDNLEGSENLRRGAFKMFWLHHFLQRDFDGGRFASTVFCRDLVIGKFLSTPQDLGTRDTRQALRVAQKGLRGHSQGGSDRQIFEVTFGGVSLHLFQETAVFPVLVNKYDRLCRALLADAGIRILVTLPSHVIHIPNIGANYPVMT